VAKRDDDLVGCSPSRPDHQGPGRPDRVVWSTLLTAGTLALVNEVWTLAPAGQRYQITMVSLDGT
jgi:hypothetical protein